MINNKFIPTGLCIKPIETKLIINYDIKNYDFIFDKTLLSKIHSNNKNNITLKRNIKKNNKSKKK